MPLRAPVACITALAALATLALGAGAPAAGAGWNANDLPITQSVNRNGVIRYAVWVKVGDWSVQAMIDTGSTGLRVLPTVFRGEVRGTPTAVAFAAGLRMDGLAAKVPVEIGAFKGTVPIEVVTSLKCTNDRPDCGVGQIGSDAFLIGGDGYPSQGYSAILGIGYPFRGSDLDNPFQALGIKRWIVDLPRPYASESGHLILEPDARTGSGFTMLAHGNGSADADGCLRGGPLTNAVCGTILFDTGAPGISATSDDVLTAITWDDGAAGTLQFGYGDKPLTMDFHAGQDGGLKNVSVAPPGKQDPAEPFILAGVSPFFAYDVLYDNKAHSVGLRARPVAAPLPALADDGR